MEQSFEGSLDQMDTREEQGDSIARYIVSVETDGIVVEKPFATEEEADAYLKVESENPNAVCEKRSIN